MNTLNTFILVFLSAIPAYADELAEMPASELIGTIRDGSSSEREAALKAIGKAGPLSESNQRRLFDIFLDRRQPIEVRTNAFSKYLEIVGIPIHHEKQLIQVATSKSESDDVRAAAIVGLQCLASHNFDDSKSFQTIFAVFIDKSVTIKTRHAAASAVCQWPKLSDQAFAAVCRVVEDDSEPADLRILTIQSMPVQLLFDRGRYTEIATTALKIAKYQQESVHLRCQALDSHFQATFSTYAFNAGFVPLSKQQSQELMGLFLNPDEHSRVRREAGSALTMLPVIDPELLPELIDALRSKERFMHEYAASIVPDVGDSAKEVVPLLIEMWVDDNETKEARRAAANAIIRIDPDRAKALGIEEK